MSEGIENIAKLAGHLNKLVDIGEEVMADGEIGFSDISQAAPLFEEVKGLVALKDSMEAMMAEAKDIDPIEAVRIVQILLAKN